MNVVFYPDKTDLEINVNKGPVVNKIKDITKNRPKLFALISRTMDDVKIHKNLDKYNSNEWVTPLKGIKEPIFEFRIPPRDKKGVIRLYFAYKKNNQNTIIILSAEIKQGGKCEANKDDIKRAIERYKEVCL